MRHSSFEKKREKDREMVRGYQAGELIAIKRLVAKARSEPLLLLFIYE